MFAQYNPASSSTKGSRSGQNDAVTTVRAIFATGRRYNQRQAFDELMDVAKRQHMSAISAARHLIDAAEGRTTTVPAG